MEVLRKFNITAFSSFSLGLTLYGMLQPSYYTKLLVSSGGVYLLMRVVISVIMIAYVFYPQARTYEARTMIMTIGAALLGFGLITFISPTFFNSLGFYMPILDTLMFAVGGILALLMGLELPAHRSTFLDRQRLYLASHMAVQKNKITHVTRAQS